MGNIHLTNKGILANKTFSVNLPSEDMVAITDHIGMVSGTKEDKSKLFDLFYGELDTAPMIEQCKVTMECRLIDHLKLPTHDLFVGEVVGTYADVDVLTNGIVDIAKLGRCSSTWRARSTGASASRSPSAGAWARSSCPRAETSLPAR